MIKKMEQGEYWNQELNSFDSIYSHKTSKFKIFLNKIFRYDMYERYNFTFRHSEPIEGKTILDVGCGTGVFSFRYAELKAKKVVGLDIAQKMVDVCNSRAKNLKFENMCLFHKTDILNFNTDEKFDISIGIGLFDYIKKPQETINKMRKLTTDRTIMSFPTYWTYRMPIRKIRLTLRKCDVFFYTKKQVKKLLMEAGYKDCKIERVRNIYCVVAYC